MTEIIQDTARGVTFLERDVSSPLPVVTDDFGHSRRIPDLAVVGKRTERLKLARCGAGCYERIAIFASGREVPPG